jgi:hypothetical protein
MLLLWILEIKLLRCLFNFFWVVLFCTRNKIKCGDKLIIIIFVLKKRKEFIKKCSVAGVQWQPF